MDSKHRFIGHTAGEKNVREQGLRDHLIATGELSAQFGAAVGLEHTCRLVGQLHDAGKYSARFQKHIKENDNAQVNHAFAGARLLFEELRQNHWLTGDFDDPQELAVVTLADMMANAIMAHHNPLGPYDFLDPIKNVVTTEVDDFAPYFPFFAKMQEPMADWTPAEIATAYFSVGEMSHADFINECIAVVAEAQRIGADELLANQLYYQRFIASCLVDADHTDTANFSINRPNQIFTSTERLLELNQINEASVVARSSQVCANEATRQLNLDRQQMSNLSAIAGDGDSGLYSLSVPTGGGKTFSSLRFALRQAQAQGMNQIIYVAPYTTIIEQNAKAIRAALNVADDDLTTVLEYHSNVVVNDDQICEEYRYTRDAWDAPVVVTTQVAFFDAIFGSGSRNLRHMHRLAHSVIIMDEVQTLPIKMIAMHNAFVNWVTAHGRATVLLCTATQPDLSDKRLSQGLTTEPIEIVPDIERVSETFARTRLVSHLDEQWTIEQLDDFITQQLTCVDSVLVVLNTKGAVKRAYEQFTQEGVRTFHLSTDMCPANRQKRFDWIRRALGHQNEQKVVVFSTRLIEAGVDLSFQMAIRSLAGLDSVVQTAGRCNRNHEMPVGFVHLVRLVSSAERMSSLKELTAGQSATLAVWKLNPSAELLAPSCIKQFFARYYDGFDRMQTMRYPYEKSFLFDWGHLLPQGHLVNNARFSSVARAKPVLGTQGPLASYGLVSAASQSISRHFQVIDSPTTPVIVGYDPNVDLENGEIISQDHAVSGLDIITALLSKETPADHLSILMKQAQAFTVQVYNLSKFSQIGYIETSKQGGIYYTMNYDPEMGISEDLPVHAMIL
ncbi:CRISPR-associated endonuclease Cas3'' [Lacticaseibacillus daqingensis]|uniref:CRISPR-associated endonuclease Cas3'' n=1 Tax=Lacticaseibacillus daqingensis TaxID=2486014 RepID=UPI000F7B5943|nr:CRISPR-associated endonuclease Cas3'' [Lacticaseibacillus daqingensis]